MGEFAGGQVLSEERAADRQSDKNADSSLKDIFQESIKEAFGPDGLSGQASENPFMQNFARQDLAAARNFNLKPVDLIATGLVTASGKALINAAALETARGIVFNNRNTFKLNELSPHSLTALSTAREVLDGRNLIGQLSGKIAEAKTIFAGSQVGLSAAELEMRTIADFYKTPFAEVKGVGADLVKERHLFFNSSKISKIGYLGSRASDYIGTAQELASGQKLFIEGGREASMLHSLEASRGAHLQSRMSLAELEASYARAADKVVQAENRLSNATYAYEGFKGFAKGVLVTGGVVGAGYAVDKSLGNQTVLDSFPRMMLDAVVTPSVLMSELPWSAKIPLAAVSFGASRAIGLADSSATRWSHKPDLQSLKLESSLKHGLSRFD